MRTKDTAKPMALTLIDGTSALIVFGGTLVATLLRCGPKECRLALRALGASLRPSFSADEARADLVRQVRAIREDGVMRARPQRVGDREFDEATEALISTRSVSALLAAHEKHKTRRSADANTAIRVLAQASELAPVFGMAGTLIALNRMGAAAASDGDAITAAVGMAVVTTLYGILAANLVLAPLARMVERASRAEIAGRDEVAEWLAAQVTEALPHLHPAHRSHSHLEPAEAA